jgi:uncharacterized metal-binding protein YceD (DUF177 family)
MNHSGLYVIPFRGLSLGAHTFEWVAGKDIFAVYEMSEIGDAQIKVLLTVVKHAQFMEVNLAMEGWAEVQCDRCLDPLKVDITTEVLLLVQFGNSNAQDSDEPEVVVLSHDDNEMDMTHYIYEYAHLALPARRVHPDDASGKSTCNEEMIKKLEQYLVRNDSDETK